MPGLLQWGRKLQVDLTLPGGVPIRLVDFDSQRVREHQGLGCTLTFTRHTSPAPQPVLCTVKNLAPLLQQQLYATVALARNQSALSRQALRAGRLVVRAGRDIITMRKVVDDEILDVEIPPDDGATADVDTIIVGQDGRLLWDNAFITTMTPVQGIAQLGAVPSPIPTPPLPTYAHAGAGQTASLDIQDVVNALGYQPVMRGDAVVWIPIAGTATYPPVILDTVAIPPIPPEGEGGKRTVTVLYNSEYMAAGPAVLQGRSYAMESITANLSTHDPNGWTASITLMSLLPG